MGLPVDLRRKIVKFLISLPNVNDNSIRQALIFSAGLDAQLQNQIKFSEPPAPFFELLVPQLVQYGQLEDGRNALEAVLKSAKNLVGADRKAYCDDLIQQLRAVSNESNEKEHPPSAPKSTESQKSDKNEKEKDEKPIPGSTDPNRQEWLKLHKFKLDPFGYIDGGKDPLLSKYFYRIPNFYDILGAPSRLETVLVFGAEGSGKSSLRNVIAQMCRADDILPVIYQDFEPLLDNAWGNYSVKLEDHMRQILKLAIKTLAEEVKEELTPLQQSSRDDETGGNEVIRSCLWSYVVEYETNAVRRENLENFLNPDKNVTEQLPTDYRELLGDFCQYTNTLFGYKSIYFLVDPDEDVSPDINIAWKVLRPLLSTPRLLDLSDYKSAFKFFLNQNFLNLALQINWISRKHARGVYTLDWSGNTLRALLKERLRQCSVKSPKSPPYVSLGELSEVDDLDHIVIQRSGEKPRELIMICNKLFNVHCQSPINRDRMLITRDEVTEAIKQLAITKTEPANFRLNKQSLENLRNEGISDEILKGLQTLVDQEITGENKFLDTVEGQIGKDQTVRYKELILKYATEPLAVQILRGEKSLDNFTLVELIAQGENLWVEFKSTMRWNLKTEKRDIEMDKNIAKTLCSFMNKEGGILIIGVDDDGKALGLSKDFEDGFELALNDILKNYLELEYRQHITNFSFENYDGKRICVVQTEKSQKPVYCLFDQGHEFYVREGNSTQRLDVKATSEYIKDHFAES